jgi:hypothetical protein
MPLDVGIGVSGELHSVIVRVKQLVDEINQDVQAGLGSWTSQ